MPNDKVAAIGDKDTVFAFRALGVDAFGVTDADAADTIKKVAGEYSVIDRNVEKALGTNPGEGD